MALFLGEWSVKIYEICRMQRCSSRTGLAGWYRARARLQVRNEQRKLSGSSHSENQAEDWHELASCQRPALGTREGYFNKNSPFNPPKGLTLADFE